MAGDPAREALRGLSIRQLRIAARSKGLSPAGCEEALKQRLAEYMRASNDFHVVTEAPESADDGGGMPQFSKNNYARPGGQQNVGNHITDRPSSRVTAPPGGASQVVLGDYQDPGAGYVPQHGRRSGQPTPPTDQQPLPLGPPAGLPPQPPRTAAQRNAEALLSRMGLGNTDEMVANALNTPHAAGANPNYAGSRPPSAGSAAAAAAAYQQQQQQQAYGGPAAGKLPSRRGSSGGGARGAPPGAYDDGAVGAGAGGGYGHAYGPAGGGQGRPPLPPQQGAPYVPHKGAPPPAYGGGYDYGAPPGSAAVGTQPQSGSDNMVADVERMIKSMQVKDLRTHCRARNLSPAGSAEELKQRLGDHMLATGNLSLAAPPPGGEGAYFGGAAPPPQQQQQHPGHYGGGAGGITYAAPVVQQGFTDLGANNNYARPGGQQNVGNFLSGKNSSRVLAPPGGKSQITFGDYQLPGYGGGGASGQGPARAPSPSTYQQQQAYASQGGAPYQQHSQGGYYPPQQQQQPPGYYAPSGAGGAGHAAAPGMQAFGGGEARPNNNYVRPGGQQNVGNFITGRPSTKVVAPPGGKSTITFG